MGRISIWIFWPDLVSYSLASVNLLGLFGILFLLFLQDRKIIGKVLLSTAFSLVVMGAAMAVCFLFMQAALSLLGHVPAFPKPLWPWRSSFLGLGLLAAMTGLQMLRRFVDFWPFTLGVWLSWGLLACVSVVSLPGVGSTLLIPALFNTLLYILLWFGKREKQVLSHRFVALCSILFALPSTLIPAVQLEDTHGYGHLFFAFLLPPMALFVVSCLPLLYHFNYLGDAKAKRSFLFLIAILAIYNLLFAFYLRIG